LVSPENVSSVVNIAASMVHTRQATPFLPDTSEPNSLTALADVNFAIHQDKQWKAAALIAFCAHDSPEWRRVIRAWMLAVPTTRASCGVDTTLARLVVFLVVLKRIAADVQDKEATAYLDAFAGRPATISDDGVDRRGLARLLELPGLRVEPVRDSELSRLANAILPERPRLRWCWSPRCIQQAHRCHRPAGGPLYVDRSRQARSA